MSNDPQPVAYFNGEMLPESRIRLPFRDRGFICGDAGYDMARTFRGRPFKLQEHVERLFRTLAYLEIDPGFTMREMTDIAHAVVAANAARLDEFSDYWVTMRVTRGVPTDQLLPTERPGPAVLVECTPLPLAARARYFRDGIDAYVSSIPRTPPSCLSPRAKTHNYLNLLLADREARRVDPNGWGIMLDVNGNLCEGIGNNIFLVREGQLLTPQERYILPGISRQTVFELATELGIAVAVGDYDLFDASLAQEMFFTSTSLCMCPVRSVNGRRLGRTDVPGPLTRALMDAFARRVDCDFVAQYLHHLEGGQQ